jgi:hypothetical protein
MMGMNLARPVDHSLSLWERVRVRVLAIPVGPALYYKKRNPWILGAMIFPHGVVPAALVLLELLVDEDVELFVSVDSTSGMATTGTVGKLMTK